MSFRRSLLVAFALGITALPAVAAKRVLNGKIAFVSNRDGNSEIYVMNPNGGGQTRLTDDPAEDIDPAWSPDGRRIAFVRNRQVHLMNADGSGVTPPLTSLGFNENPAWSPDGQRIAFQSSRDSRGLINFEIYVMFADGSSQTRLTFDDGQDLSPAWSPDGRSIAFMSERFDPDAQNICTMNPDGTNVQRLTDGVRGPYDDEPSFSPDGKKIVFDRGPSISITHRVMIMNTDGSEQNRLALGTYSPGTFTPDSHPVFSPDGTKIAFGSDLLEGADTRIQIMDPDGSNEEVIASNDGFVNEQPSWQRTFPPDTTGVYVPSTGAWLLRNSNTTGGADIVVKFGGQPGDLPVAGDWNGDGRTDIAVFRDGTFLRARLKEAFVICPGCPTFADPFDSVSFGEPGDLPIAGDWDGDRTDDLGVFRPSTGEFHLRIPKTLCPICLQTIFVTQTLAFPGPPQGLPVAGDWNGDGNDTVGFFDPGSAVFAATDDLAKPNFVIQFGLVGDLPLAGDWLGGSRDSVGVFQPANVTMALSTTISGPPNIVFGFGVAEGLPVAGHWTAVP